MNRDQTGARLELVRVNEGIEREMLTFGSFWWELLVKAFHD